VAQRGPTGVSTLAPAPGVCAGLVADAAAEQAAPPTVSAVVDAAGTTANAESVTVAAPDAAAEQAAPPTSAVVGAAGTAANAEPVTDAAPDAAAEEAAPPHAAGTTADAEPVADAAPDAAAGARAAAIRAASSGGACRSKASIIQRSTCGPDFRTVRHSSLDSLIAPGPGDAGAYEAPGWEPGISYIAASPGPGATGESLPDYWTVCKSGS
jgi:hypothetical protein